MDTQRASSAHCDADAIRRWRGKGEEQVESCTIVTTDANDKMAELHDPMPVILAPACRTTL